MAPVDCRRLSGTPSFIVLTSGTAGVTDKQARGDDPFVRSGESS